MASLFQNQVIHSEYYMPELYLNLYIQRSILRLNTASSLNKEGLADTANTTSKAGTSFDRPTEPYE